MSTTLRPFLMDEGKEDFVVFMLQRDNTPNAYIWVRLREGFDPERDIRVSNFYGLCSYCTHTTDPFYAGAIPEDVIEDALRRLDECPDGVMAAKMDDFNKDMEWKMENENIFREYSEWEDKTLKEAEKCVDTGNPFVYF